MYAKWWNSGLVEQNPFAGTRTLQERIDLIPQSAKSMKINVVNLVVDENQEKAFFELKALIYATNLLSLDQPMWQVVVALSVPKTRGKQFLGS